MIKRFFGAVALLCALAGALTGIGQAQNTTTFGNIVSMGVPCGSSNCVYYQLPAGVPWVSVTVTGTWTGTLETAVTSAPNANYSNLSSLFWTALATNTANGTSTVATNGSTYLRVRATSWTSGSARVAMDSTLTQAPLMNPVFPGGLTGSGLTAPNGGSVSTCWTTSGAIGACEGGTTPGTAQQATYYNSGTTIASAAGSVVYPLGFSGSTPVQGPLFGAFSNHCEYNIPAGGTITKIVPTFLGHGYTAPPVLTIAGGGGTGLSLTAVLGGQDGTQVVSYTINNPGSGYTSCPNVTMAKPGTNPTPVSVVDYRNGPNATQAINSVSTFGAMCDGVTDDTIAIQAAMNYATQGGTVAGRISFPPGKTCLVGEPIGGYLQTGWDDGTPPTQSGATCNNRNTANGLTGSTCTQLAPETPGYIAYALASSSSQGAGLTIEGNNATIKGPFNPNPDMLNLPLTVQTMASPYFSLFGATMSGMTINNLTISNYFIGAASLAASQSTFNNVTFNQVGIGALYANAQLVSWNNTTTSNTGTPIVLGGYWDCANINNSCANSLNIFDATVLNNTNFNGLNFDTLAHFNTAVANLNTWFDVYFYHTVDNYNRLSDQVSASLTPGGCNSTACLTDYVGIYGNGYNEYSRQGRPQIFLGVTNLNSRSANGREVVMTYAFEPNIQVGSGETAGVCNNSISIIYGSAACPDAYNYSTNHLTAPVLLWGEQNPTVDVTGGDTWTSIIGGPTNLSDATNSNTMQAAGFERQGGAGANTEDAGYYSASAALGFSTNNYFGLNVCSKLSSGKSMCAQTNAYNQFGNFGDDGNSYIYGITGNFNVRQQSNVSNAQAGVEVPGLLIRPQEFAGAQGGNVTSLTITNRGSGYAPLTSGSVTMTGCVTSPVAGWFSNAAGAIVTVKVFYGGFGCTSANPPVATMPASSGTTATLSPVYNTWDQAGFVSDFGSKRFNLLATPLVIPAGDSVAITGVTIPGLNFGGALPPFEVSVPFTVYEPGLAGFTNLTYKAVTTGTNTATVTIENNTPTSQTAPTGAYAAVWTAAEPIAIVTPPAASGTVGTVGPKFVSATSSPGLGSLTGSGTTASHTFSTAFGATPNCQVTPTSNSGGYFVSAKSASALTVTYVTSGAQTFDVLCLGSGGVW